MDLEEQPLTSAPAVSHGGGSSSRQILMQSVQMFLAGTSYGSPPVSRGSSSKSVDGSPELDKNDRYVDIKEGVVECVNSNQTAPLLMKADNTSQSKKRMKTLVRVIHSVQAFKAIKASVHHVTIKNLSTIVRQKNLLALQEFGDLGGVKCALCTDFDNGISDNEALNRRKQHASSRNLAPTNTFFHFVWEEVKKETIILLLVSLTLSSVLGILQDGLKYGSFEEAVTLIAIALLVLFASIRKYWQEKSAQKKLRSQHLLEREVGEVQVRRGGQSKVICKSELVSGDILLLKKGDEVPCDGLFVGGEPLELDYGDESCMINEQDPFLSHGEKVINGDARMVVTSTNMESGWSEMMRKAVFEPNMRFRLVTQLDKLNTRMHHIQIVNSILLVAVLMFRYAARKIDGENGNGPESVAEPTGMRSISDTFTKIINESKYTTKVLTKLLCVSLVGLTEGVPFVVSIAIVYWNNKTLSAKATEQDPHGLAKMAHVTRVCTDTFITKDVIEVEKVFIGGDSLALSPDVIDVPHDGIDKLSQKPFRQVKAMFGSKRKNIWRGVEMKGAKSFEEPCGVLMRETAESEELVWRFNGPVTKILKQCKHYYDINGIVTPLDEEMTQKFAQANQDRQDKHKFTTVALASCAQTQDEDDLILIALLVLKNKNNEDTNAQVTTALRERRIETVIVSSKKIPIIKQDMIACECEVITNCDSEEPFVVTGKVFRNYTSDERLDKVDKIHILGEALPSDQLLLVETMKEKGEVVAFLGQTTNEVPALKTAHIGIAVGTRSSEKAKENCDILMYGSFSDLISMVDYGKCIYYNIECFLQIVLIMTCSSTLIGLIEIAAFGDASLTIFQLALVNFAVVFLGGLALLTKELTDKPSSLVPISCEQSIITAVMARNILFQVLYQVICSVIIQLKGSAVMGPNQDMKAVVSIIFIFSQFFNLFNSRELQKKNCFKGIHQHKEFWVAIAMFIVLHAVFFMGQYLLGYGTRLNWKIWACCVLLGAISWVVDWLGKCIWGSSRYLSI
ncbi:calcium-transporting ATPase 12, plasma membrane-type-like [Bidens hawaiensis]|uniref:calcium-transporting ATPase 12, plasma membrane-type-like n=1 Tax=Bidens hawaiensis TaxID=980011 RepID=UPI0040491F24